MPLPRLSLVAVFAAALIVWLLPATALERTASGSSTAASEVRHRVDVHSILDPDLRPYRIMIRGLDAYADHLQLAPEAPLRFILFPARPEVTMDGITLHLTAENLLLPIPLAPDNSFVLAREKMAYDANADLVSNRKRASLQWGPDIHTPGLPPNVRRLGDLRLECEIRWAVEQDSLSLVMRSFFRMAGGYCRSSMLRMPFASRRALVSVEARSGERTMRVRLMEDQRRYVPPLHDRSWDDDTLLTLTYASQNIASGGQAHAEVY